MATNTDAVTPEVTEQTECSCGHCKDTTPLQDKPQDSKHEELFTQEQVNKIVAERLSRAKTKMPEDYESLREQALQAKEATKRAQEAEQAAQAAAARAERLEMLAKVSEKTGVPTHLIQGATEEEMEASANACRQWAEALRPSYPLDKGGSPAGVSAVSVSSIENIANPIERIRARSKNANLYR